MKKITPQTVFLPIDVNEELEPNVDVNWVDEHHWLKEQKEMVVLTREQFRRLLTDAIAKGYSIFFSQDVISEKDTYINSIIKP